MIQLIKSAGLQRSDSGFRYPNPILRIDNIGVRRLQEAGAPLLFECSARRNPFLRIEGHREMTFQLPNLIWATQKVMLVVLASVSQNPKDRKLKIM